MSLVPRPNIDQTDKDFDSLRTRLQNLVQSVFPDWTSQNVADFGNLLADLFCHVGDVLGYYIDAWGQESRITRATQRRSMLALCKLVGYTPSGASAATADVTVTLDEVPANNVTIPAGTVVKTLAVTDPVEFQLLVAQTIAAGTNPPVSTATYEHSSTRVESYPSTGLPDQEVVLGATPFLDGTETATADDGAYSRVTNFLSSESGDRHYIVRVDQEDRARLRFGDGVNGQIPVGTVDVSYRVGGGEAGNVAAGMLQRFDGQLYDSLSNPVTVASATNAARASGGAERQSVDSIREEAPASLTALTRSVCRTDYETHARGVAGVARALMLASDDDDRVPENTGYLYVVPDGGGTASQTLLDTVLVTLTSTYPCTITFDVQVFTAAYEEVDVQASVFFRTGYDKAAVAQSIVAAVQAYFALETSDGVPNSNVMFGLEYREQGQDALAEIPYSDVYNAVRDVAGVYKISGGVGGLTLNGESADVAIDTYKFPALGTIRVVDGSSGALVLEV